MPSRTIFEKRRMRDDVSPSGLQQLTVPTMTFTVALDLDTKASDAIGKDAILLEEMNKAAAAVYEQACKNIKSQLAAFDRLINDMVDKNAPNSLVDAQKRGLVNAIDVQRDNAIKEAETKVAYCWTRYQKKRHEYSKYKIKIGSKIIGNTAGLVSGIALTATGGLTGGLSSAVAILGILKSGLKLVDEITKASLEIEKAQKLLQSELNLLKKISQPLAARKANKFTAMVFKQFVGISGPTIQSCIGHMETINSKLAGVEISAHKMSGKLNDMLDEQEKLKQNLMREVTKKLEKHPSSKAKNDLATVEKNLSTYLKSINSELRVNAMIETVRRMHARAIKAQEATEQLERQVQPLKKLTTLDEKIVRNVLALADFPLALMAGNAIATDADQIRTGLAPAVALFAWEKISDAALEHTLLG